MNQKTRPTPRWLAQLISSFAAGEAHGFVVTGDVRGYVAYGLPHAQLLLETLSRNREIVLRYAIGSGITFPTPGMREAALAALGPASPTSSTNMLLSALGSAQPADPFDVRQPVEALRLVDRLLRLPSLRGRLAVIIEDVDLLCPNSAYGKGSLSVPDREVLALLRGWGADSPLASADNPIVLMARVVDDIAQDIRDATSGWRVIRIPMPEADDRAAFIREWSEQRAQDGQPVVFNELDVSQMATLTAGLSLRHIEDILLLGAHAGAVTRELVKRRKDDIIAADFSEVAEMLEPLPDTALGGQQRLRRWAAESIVYPLREGRVHDAPKGVLLVGPPGSGKTYFVRWLAGAVGFNAVALRAENVLGGIVGESERRLQRFFSFARSLAPTLVFMDELDQSDMARRGTGSGNPVASNLFSQMLQFMSDETLRGRVIVVFATNRPDLIDSALLRTGRMDAIIPVLLPEEAERAAILAAQARVQQAEIMDDALTWAAANTSQWSASDLAALVRKARTIAGARLDLDSLRRALNRLRPAGPQTAEYYTLLAVNACNDADLLPAAYAALLDDRAGLARRLAELNPEPSGSEPMRRRRFWEVDE